MTKFSNRITNSSKNSSIILANDYNNKIPKLESKTIQNIKSLHEYICGLKINFHLLLKLGKKKGYGYWVWQTFFHKKVLSQINEGDIYHWCDVGCHFNLNGKTRLKEYIKILEKEPTGFLGFQYKDLERIK